MITAQVISTGDARERARKAFTDYLSMFLPGSWLEPLARLKLILQANGDTDWEALKGQALQLYDERRHSKDRVESLARVERLADACKELRMALSPAEWHKTLEDIIYAAQFRTSKIAVQTKQFHGFSEESDTIMDVYEPYLLQLGFLERTPRGRLATQLAYQHLGLPYNKEKPPQATLW